MRCVLCLMLAVVGSILCGEYRAAGADTQLPPVPVRIPFTLTAHGHDTNEPSFNGTLEFHDGEARWDAPEDARFSFARLKTLSTECKESSHEFQVDLVYMCQGPKNPKRRFCFETRALDRDGKLLAHDWQIEADNRLGPKTIPWNSYTMVLSRDNSPFNRFPRTALADVARLDVRLTEYPVGTPRHFSNGPHKLDLAITRPDKCGDFMVTFTNPAGWNLDPSKHQIAFELWVRDAKGHNVCRETRLLSCREDGNYRQRVHVERKYFDHSSIGISVFTRQADNQQFVRDFFIDRIGSKYHGMWTGDGGKLVELPIKGVPLFSNLPEIAAAPTTRGIRR